MKKEKIILIVLSILVLVATLFDARLGLVVSLIGVIIYVPIHFYSKDSSIKRKKMWAIVTVSILTAVMIVLNIRFFSSEDDWICNNGQWVMHGHPSTPMPNEICR